MITFDILKEMNDSGELPKKFTDEELKKIAEAESMACGMGCAFCPMAQYEFVNISNEENKKDLEKNKNSNIDNSSNNKINKE